MASIKERLASARAHHPLLDHVLSMQEHYGRVKAGQQAGAVTYFAFLSFFPILALSLFVVGIISTVYPDARDNLVTAIDSVLPDIVGDGEGEISLDSIGSFSGLAGILGVLGVLYSGLAWISALRDALLTVFETPMTEQPSFVKGKLRDLLTLSVIGLVLIVSVAVAGFVSGFSASILGFLELDKDLSWLVKVIAVVVGLAANTVLFYAIFRLLAEPELPRRALWRGALLGAVGFEVLKQISTLLLASTRDQPAFQAFGIALILVVWINYFSRLLLYSATWAYTAPESEAQRARGTAAPAPVQGPATPALVRPRETPSAARTWVGPFAAGGATVLALMTALRKKDPR